MLQKGSYLVPVDKCGVWWVSIFHVFSGFSKRIGYSGDFIKVSVKLTKPNNWVLKKTKLNSIVVLVMKNIRVLDNSVLRFKINSCVLLKRRLSPKGKEIIGPVPKTIRRKKFLMSFSGVI